MYVVVRRLGGSLGSDASRPCATTVPVRGMDAFSGWTNPIRNLDGLDVDHIIDRRTGREQLLDNLPVLGGVHRRDLHVFRRGLAAAVPDDGDQGVLEAAPPNPVLLLPDRPRHGRQPDPWHLWNGLRGQRSTAVSSAHRRSDSGGS